MGDEVRAYQHLVAGCLAHVAQVGSDGLQLLVVLLDQPGSDLTMGREEEKASASALRVRATGLGREDQWSLTSLSIS